MAASTFRLCICDVDKSQISALLLPVGSHTHHRGVGQNEKKIKAIQHPVNDQSFPAVGRPCFIAFVGDII